MDGFPDDCMAAGPTGIAVGRSNQRRPAVLPRLGQLTPVVGEVGRTGNIGLLQERNRRQTLPAVIDQVVRAGNIENVRRLVEATGLAYKGGYPFLDTDVYKTLEAVAYELALARDHLDEVDDHRELLEQTWSGWIDLLERAQQADGYLNSWFQSPDVVAEPFSDMVWGHELYNLGHLLQAGIAGSRQLEDDRLLRVGRRFADLAAHLFGTGGRQEVCGHPEVEMALVELSRETGDPRYRDLAQVLVNRRGHGRVRATVFPADYFQDATPLRELDSVTGHAVRMVYLASGATDVAVDTGDEALLAAMVRLWQDLVDTKLYITGGVGARHADESFGDRYELPSERSYAETCASIGLLQWSWRLFLATGEARFADLYELVLNNALAAAVSLDGTRFFYDNPLQRRPDHTRRTGDESSGPLLRRSWFRCPCCPPNVARMVAQLHEHLAAEEDGVLVLTQYSTARVQGSALEVDVDTEYPVDGEVRIRVTGATRPAATLRLRVPAWCHEPAVLVDGVPAPVVPHDGWLNLTRSWRVGDTVSLSLPMRPRASGGHQAVDAVHGAVAVSRGPLVFCAEQQDASAALDRVVVSPADVVAAEPVPGPGWMAGQPTALALRVRASAEPEPAGPEPLYPDLARDPAGDRTPADLLLVPYALWGNRQPGAMRVWHRRI